MLRKLVLSVTYRCNIQCRLCGVFASPLRNEQMCLSNIRKIIEEVYAYGTVELVVFTGGEPFLLGDELYRAVEFASKKNLLTRIVTNAFWAVTPNCAHDVLARLKDCGLTEINYSCDDFHQEHIPINNIYYAVQEAATLNLPSLIASKGLRGSKISPEFLDAFFGVKLARFKTSQANPTDHLLSYTTTVPIGWKSEMINESDLLFPDEIDSWKAPCSSVLEDIIIDPNLNLVACCGIGSVGIPELTVGNINNKSIINLLKDGNNDLFLNWLALEGPYGIQQYVKEKIPTLDFKTNYVGQCHLCNSIFSRKEVREILCKVPNEKILELTIKRAMFENRRPQMLVAN